jgi:hypothetical protein
VTRAAVVALEIGHTEPTDRALTANHYEALCKVFGDQVMSDLAVGALVTDGGA